ncbi:MAG TPA: hypothetical protein VFY31_03660 [Macromonas sp.]|nr:hypothetical protein [Macromonas sp.]
MKGRVARLTLLLSLGLAACAGGPPKPAWQGDAHDAQQLAMAAELDGNTRIAQAEWRRARVALASTAQPAWVARLELSRCAVQQASLDMRPCDAFAALQADAAVEERAYLNYLEARPTDADVALLPAAHRAVAQALLHKDAAAGGGARLLAQVEDPLATLVAASVLLRSGLADADVQQRAVDTASAQGWRRPLLAWLTLQAEAARQSGQTERVQQIERRRALLLP